MASCVLMHLSGPNDEGIAVCQTHGMMPLLENGMCPVGVIEEATDLALKKLNAGPATKREFMIQYVLNRAQRHAGGMCGALVAEGADKAWAKIEELSANK